MKRAVRLVGAGESGTVRSAGANCQPDLAACLLVESSSGLAASLQGGL